LHAEDIGWPPKKTGKTIIVAKQNKAEIISLFDCEMVAVAA